MDVYEFTQVLRRQKWLLLIGSVIIVGAIAIMGFEFNNGVSFRAGPEYETRVQLAVVPADFETLAGTVPNPVGMVGAALIHATLLASPEAFVQIEEAVGRDLVGLRIEWTGNDSFIGVVAVAQDRDASRLAALESYDWLRDRIAAPPTVTRLGQAEPPITRFDGEGEYSGAVGVYASSAFRDDPGAQGLWITVTSAEDGFGAGITDAADAPQTHFITGIHPGGDLTISLESALGNRLDSTSVVVPEVPDPAVPYDLILGVNHGAIVGTSGSEDAAGPGTQMKLVEERFTLDWIAVADDVVTAEQEPLSLLLLTEDPIPVLTGARRGPILVMAALLVGFFGLLVVAVSIDSWQQAKRKGENARAADVNDFLRGREYELNDRETAGDATNESGSLESKLQA